MPYLLDVSTLVALCDSNHEKNVAVENWFSQTHEEGWFTCPITENGLVRILGKPNYPKGPGSPELAIRLLGFYRDLPTHRFCPDHVSFYDRDLFISLKGVGANSLTDIYLLALAASIDCQFATLDKRIEPSVLDGGVEAYHIIS